jgi:hypothetical protein
MQMIHSELSAARQEARELAKAIGRSVRVRRVSGGWLVEAPEDAPSSVAGESAASSLTTIVESEFTVLTARCRELVAEDKCLEALKTGLKAAGVCSQPESNGGHVLEDLFLRKKALEEFKLLLEDMNDVRTREHANELLWQLEEVAERLGGWEVERRVRKEMRELIERRTSLPSEEIVVEANKAHRAYSRLLAIAPSCRKCGRPMLPQPGPSFSFWGCSTFPECWSRRWFGRTEFDILDANA